MINYNNIHNILASITPPNPKSTRYWADLSEDPTGGVLKRFKDGEWQIINEQSLEAAEFALDQIKLINDKITNLTGNTPEVLDTLKEISDALGGDPEFANNVAAKFEAINTELDNIKSKDLSQDSDITSINNSILSVTTSITSINKDINTINTKVGNNTSSIETINTNISDINSSISDINSALDTTNKNVETNKSDIATINNNIASINTFTAGLDNEIDINKTSINNINSAINIINDNIATINNSITSANEKITSNTTKISTIEGKVSTLESNISTLLAHKAQVDATLNTIDEDIITIKNDIRTLYDVKEDKSSFAGDENTYAYGVAKAAGSTSPTFVRMGSMQLHKDLPIHNKIKGCTLADDGTVNHYFNSDWTANEDGTEIIKDGSDGMVMVEIPEFYIKYITGDSEGYMISEYPLEGYTKTEKVYVSAYEATVDRTDSSAPKLASVMSMNVNFRGGNNNSSLDDTEKSQLGKPASNISRASFRTYARNRGSINWNLYDMYTHNLIWILYTIEYASTNSQLAVNNTLTSTGYKQGGLGNGVTTVGYSDWGNFNGYCPFVPCGTSDSLGNDSGEVSFTLPESWKEGSTVTVKVPRYRGIENPFGHIWKNADGVIFDIKKDADGGTSDIMVCDKPFYYSDSLNGQYTNIGQLPRKEGYTSQVINRTVYPTAVGASATTGLCDYFYTNVNSSSLRTCFLGGSASNSASAGLATVYSTYAAVSTAGTTNGSRLVYRTVIEQ